MADAPASRLQRRGLAASLDLGDYPWTLGVSALTCALTPAYTVRWHVGFYPTTLLELSIVATVIAFAVETWRLHRLPSIRTEFTLPAAVFLLAGAVSVVVAPDRRAALGIYRAYLIEPVVFFLVLSNVLTAWRKLRLLVLGLGLAGVVVGVANSIVILDAIRHHTLQAGLTAPVVIYTNANDIALFLVPLIAVAGAVALHGRDRADRLLAGAFLLIAVGSTVLSFSRGGYLALAAVAIGLALSHRFRWRLLGAAFVVGIAVALVPPVTRRLAVEVDFSNPQNTLVGRFELWRVSLQMLGHHIPFGAGLSGFAQTIAPYWNPTHADRFIYPHNIVLTFWSETGLLGLLAFAWLVFTALRCSWRAWNEGGTDWRPLGLGVLLAMIAVITHGLVDVPYFKNDLALEFWVLVAAGWVAVRTLATPVRTQAG